MNGIDDYDNHDDVEKDDGNISDNILDDDTLSSTFLSISYNNEVDVYDDER
jgi:hypothetical protein